MKSIGNQRIHALRFEHRCLRSNARSRIKFKNHIRRESNSGLVGHKSAQIKSQKEHTRSIEHRSGRLMSVFKAKRCVLEAQTLALFAGGRQFPPSSPMKPTAVHEQIFQNLTYYIWLEPSFYVDHKYHSYLA